MTNELLINQELVPEVKEKWVAALLSGDYTQGHNMLRDYDGGYCCLGVLCDLAAKAGVGHWDEGDFTLFVVGGDCQTNVLPKAVARWAFGLAEDTDREVVGLTNPIVTKANRNGVDAAVMLAELNDGSSTHHPHSFAEIADVIKERL